MCAGSVEEGAVYGGGGDRGCVQGGVWCQDLY